MTPALAAKALLYVALHFPIGNARVARRIETFARAVPKLAATPTSLAAATAYIDGCGLAESSPWRASMLDVVDALRPLPPTSLRLRLVNDLAFASTFTATAAPIERRPQVAALLDQLLPK